MIEQDDVSLRIAPAAPGRRGWSRMVPLVAATSIAVLAMAFAHAYLP